MDKGVVACLDECVVGCLDKNNRDKFYLDIRHSLDDFLDIFYSLPLWDIFLKETWVSNIYSTMVILRKVAVLIHM